MTADHAPEAPDATRGGLSEQQQGAESPRADVELTEGEREALYRANGSRGDLVSTVEGILADRLAAVQAERALYLRHIDIGTEQLAAMTARAESAEAERDRYERLSVEWSARAEVLRAERDDLRARLLAVEALAEEYAAEGAAREAAGRPAWPNNVARDLRAAFASPSTHTQREAEVGARECQTCGPNDVEQHPRRPGVTRCTNCKAWLTRADSLATGEER